MSVDPTPKKFPAWDLAIGSFVALSLLGALLLGIVPKFADVFRQVRVPVNSSTELCFALASLLRSYVDLGIVVLLLVPWGLGRLRGKPATVARTLLPMATIAVLGWITLALFLPLIGELEGVHRHS